MTVEQVAKTVIGVIDLLMGFLNTSQQAKAADIIAENLASRNRVRDIGQGLLDKRKRG